MTHIAPLDIVEIETDDGLAYTSITHVHPIYPPVVRLCSKRFRARPCDLAQQLEAQDYNTLLMPLEAVLTQLELNWQVVGQLPNSAGTADFPTFRMPIRDREGRVVYWWYWDGEGLRFDTEKTDIDPSGAKNFPLREVTGAVAFSKWLLALERAA